jgi:hypothetical protein
MRFLFFLVGLTALAFVAMPVMWAFLGATPWLLFGLAIWAGCTLLRPRRRYYSPLPPQWERARVREPYRRPDPPRPVESKPTLPLDVQVKIDQVRHKAELLEREKDRFPFASEDLYVVRATRADYLPRTVDAFLALPHLAREKVMANGKTPLQELKDQLALLDSKLDEIAEDLQRRNVDRLLANRRFLEERFGRVVEV